MTDEQKAAYVNSQTASMLAELAAMQAHDRGAAALNQGCYTEEAYAALPAKYGLGCNDVVSFFHG